MSKIIKKKYSEEAVAGFSPRTAMEEAARCLLCHDAPCSKGCPAGTDPGKFIRSIRFRNVKGAAETIRENNPLGATCARVCPYDRLCEEECSRCGIDKPIEIGKLQRFATEQEKLFKMKIVKAPSKKKGMKVACIGSGPASLACASELARAGYEVSIFEMMEKPGGVLTYGITPTRLPQHVVDQDIKAVKDLGVKFHNNVKIGDDLSLDELKKSGFDAIFMGMGMWQAKMPDIKGNDLKGVTQAVSFLKEARDNKGADVVGQSVIVIGGGDVAMDCAVTAKLSGAEKVAIYYRRTLEEAPADIAEIQFVISLGITITTNMVPSEITGNGGKAEFMMFNGRDGVSGAKVKVDTIVFAIGQAPEPVEKIANIALTEKGTIATKSNVKTSVNGIFAGGDIVNGGKTVVEAVAEGKIAALKIAEYLEKLPKKGKATLKDAMEKSRIAAKTGAKIMKKKAGVK